MSIASKLTHRISILGIGPLDAYGQRTPGPLTSDVPCFIDGRLRRIAGKDGEGVVTDFSVLLLPDTDVDIGYTVSDGVDRYGNSLLSSGRVVFLEDSNHPVRGRVVREIYVARN